MYGEERKTIILETLHKNPRVDVQELSQQFEVSESTIRRDLKELEEDKLLKRTHGGAVAINRMTYEATYLEKTVKYEAEKRAIAKKAVEFIRNGDSILLDSGTTTYYLAQELRSFSKLQVVTNSLLCANELKDVPGIEVLMCGGFLRSETFALVGPFAENCLDQIRVDKSFIATNAVDVKNGITTPNLIEATTKKKMIECAKEVILVADHSKLGQVTFAKVAEINEIDHLITDIAAQKDIVEKIKEAGVSVYIVEP